MHDQFLSIFFLSEIRWEGLFLYKRINKLVSIRLNEFLSFVFTSPHEVFVIILKSQKKKKEGRINIVLSLFVSILNRDFSEEKERERESSTKFLLYFPEGIVVKSHARKKNTLGWGKKTHIRVF